MLYLGLLLYFHVLYIFIIYIISFLDIFTINQIYRLWDCILVHSALDSPTSPFVRSLPHFMAVAILFQLREKLLISDFNACILLLSNLSFINIEQCIEDALNMFNSTPKSLTFLKYSFKKVFKLNIYMNSL